MRPQKRIKYLSDEEICLLEKAIGLERDRILLEILYETGCTIKEAVNLSVDDIDTAHCGINFPAESTKSKTPKTATISTDLNKRIIEFLGEREKQGTTSRYLFCTRQSEQMTTKRARQLFSHYGIEAGLGKILPQMIRYAHVIHAVDQGIPLNAMKKQTGLDKIRLVQICDAISKPDVEDPYRRFFERQPRPEEKRHITNA